MNGAGALSKKKADVGLSQPLDQTSKLQQCECPNSIGPPIGGRSSFQTYLSPSLSGLELELEPVNKHNPSSINGSDMELLFGNGSWKGRINHSNRVEDDDDGLRNGLKSWRFLVIFIMNSVSMFILCALSLVIMALQVLSLPPSPPRPPFSLREALSEAKTRLGSTPPSCHNKCNGCHPCMASQVPSMPISDYSSRRKPAGLFDPYPSENRYSNYKPLGWKCLCGNHFYNP